MHGVRARCRGVAGLEKPVWVSVAAAEMQAIEAGIAAPNAREGVERDDRELGQPGEREGNKSGDECGAVRGAR
jgi:hypothetical protein